MIIPGQYRFLKRTPDHFTVKTSPTNFYPNAVNGGYGAVLTAQPTTNTKVGQNATVNSGSLGLSLYEPRQISLSARLRF